MKVYNFKKWALLGLILLIVAGCISINFVTAGTTTVNAPKLYQPPQSTVSIVKSSKAKATDLKYEDIRKMVRDAVSMAGGFKGLIKDNTSVVIKPNLVNWKDYTLPGWGGYPLDPEVNGCTTDYRVTKAIVELVREYNPHGKVYVMEGSAVSTATAMQKLNYTSKYIPNVDEFVSIEKDSGAWHDYNSPGIVKVLLPNGLIHKEYYLNKKYQEADVLISVPCLKTHWSAAVTGGIKNVSIGASPGNIYGGSAKDPGRNSMVAHDAPGGDLHKWIHDFFISRPVDFVIMDGLQGIQNGPTPSFNISGTDDLADDQKNMRLILAGRDAVAVDTIESLIMNWDPKSVKHLEFLNKSKAGNSDTSKILVVGKQVDEVRKTFEGNTPAAGGKKVTDKTPPKVKISKSSVKKGVMSLSLTIDKEVTKVEILVDGKRNFPIITKNFGSITCDISNTGKGKRQITIWAFDRFLNRSKTTINVTNDVDKKKVATPTPKVSDGNYKAPRASAEPIIDGIGADTCWASAPWAPIDNLWLGEPRKPEDLSGRYKIVWTPKKLYYLAEMTDSILSPVNPNPLVDYPDYDCLELFLDENCSGGDHTLNYNAFAYHIDLNYNIVDIGKSWGGKLYNNHISAHRTKNGNVYTWELAVDVYNDKYDENSPSSNIPVTLTPNKELGFALAYCNADNTKGRKTFIGSIDIPAEDKNVAWKDAGVFGVLKLLP